MEIDVTILYKLLTKEVIKKQWQDKLCFKYRLLGYIANLYSKGL
jgi:hypothetical protein